VPFKQSGHSTNYSVTATNLTVLKQPDSWYFQISENLLLKTKAMPKMNFRWTCTNILAGML
jgi:hypothetical protein